MAGARGAGEGVGVDAEGDAGFGKIVGAHFHFNFIPDAEADEVFAHFPGDMGQDFVAVGEPDPEGGAFHDGFHRSFNFNRISCHAW